MCLLVVDVPGGEGEGAEVVREHPATILRRPTRAPHTAPPAAQPARSDLKTASLPPRLIAVAMAMLHWPRPQPGLQQHQAAGGQDSAVGADAGGARRPLRRKMVRAVLPRELIGPDAPASAAAEDRARGTQSERRVAAAEAGILVGLAQLDAVSLQDVCRTRALTLQRTALRTGLRLATSHAGP